jgi:hypothetical protein
MAAAKPSPSSNVSAVHDTGAATARAAQTETTATAATNSYSLHKSRPPLTGFEAAAEPFSLLPPNRSLTRVRISSEGHLQQSFDNGKTWVDCALGSGETFRAVSRIGSEVWAGGSAGILLHSKDGGAHWEAVALPSANPGLLFSDATRTSDPNAIVSIVFRDAKHGDIVTASGRRWQTQDGGRQWTLATD